MDPPKKEGRSLKAFLSLSITVTSHSSRERSPAIREPNLPHPTIIAFFFFVFFLLGYYVRFEHIVALRKKINRAVAFGVLLLIILGIMSVTSKLEYSLCLSVLSRGANVTSFNNWYTAVVAHFVVFIFTLITGALVMVVLPERGKLFEHFGKDTMPMYLSHLIVFMACGFVVDKGNWVMAIAISTLAMVGCLVVFSTDLYEKAFNYVLSISKNVILKK